MPFHFRLIWIALAGSNVFWERRLGLRETRINLLHNLEPSAIPTARCLLIIHHRVRPTPDDLQLPIAAR